MSRRDTKRQRPPALIPTSLFIHSSFVDHDQVTSIQDSFHASNMRCSALFTVFVLAVAAFTNTVEAAADKGNAIAPQVHPCGPFYPACIRRCRKFCKNWSPEDCQACYDDCEANCNDIPRAK
ncbi:hypothetical protein BCR44DRAFT_85451 [Catenaria anguillulae PL171]|uniref:Uncharacterized protein n=1 Tax=Catenaria anguillulae PL171 TaxID=765915 RepID=A0A1Y2HK73_9FUNG|nr:hypothetical protein BCR44DRAFT_85451 [Catenaria anguillulae PL171]